MVWLLGVGRSGGSVTVKGVRAFRLLRVRVLHGSIPRGVVCAVCLATLRIFEHRLGTLYPWCVASAFFLYVQYFALCLGPLVGVGDVKPIVE